MFLAIAVDNLSNPGTLVDAKKLSQDQRLEIQGQSEGQEVIRTDIDGPSYAMCAVNVLDERLNGGSEEEYCQQKETISPHKMAESHRSLFLFLPKNKLRRACHMICNNPHFGNQ